MELAPYLCYHWDFLLDFFTEDKSYQYLQDASSLPCYLIRALSKLSQNIRNIGSSPFRTDFFPTGSDGQPHLHMREHKEGENGQFHMENWKFFQYSDPRISALLSDIKPNEVASFSP